MTSVEITDCLETCLSRNYSIFQEIKKIQSLKPLQILTKNLAVLQYGQSFILM